MPYEEPVVVTHTTERAPQIAWHKRVYWSAIFAGVVLALVIQLLLNLLGLSIGFAVIDPASNDTPSAAALGIGAYVWWLASGVIALFAGGWVAARLAGVGRRTASALHGLVVWGVATLAMVYMAVSATGNLVGGALNVVSTTVQAAGQGVAAVARPVASQASQAMQGADIDVQQRWEQARDELYAMLRETGDPNLQPEALEREAREAASTLKGAALDALQQPSRADEELSQAIEQVVKRGKRIARDVDTEEVAGLLAERTDMSQQEAERAIERWQDQVAQGTDTLQSEWKDLKRSAVQKTEEVAESTAEGLAAASFWAFFTLLLGAISAGAGGLVGAPKDDETRSSHTHSTGRPVRPVRPGSTPTSTRTHHPDDPTAR